MPTRTKRTMTIYERLATCQTGELERRVLADRACHQFTRDVAELAAKYDVLDAAAALKFAWAIVEGRANRAVLAAHGFATRLDQLHPAQPAAAENGTRLAIACQRPDETEGHGQ